MPNLEPYLMERIDAAREKARKLIDGQYDDEESIVLVLRWFICQARNLGFFDPYFEKRTVDDLVFETEMIRLSRQANTARGSDALKEAPKKEAEALFDDWAAADTTNAEKQFEDDAKKFMNSGDFK